MAKSRSSFFIILIVCAALCGFLSVPGFAAIVEGDQVVRYVDTPTGTIIYQGTAIDASPKGDGSGSQEYVPEAPAQESARPTKRHKTAVQNEIPEVPNFEAEVEAPVKKHKNNTTLFLVIGAIAIIIGVGVILFIAKSREKE